MAIIERMEILMVTLEPQVVRTDAIQSFVSQETPIVRVYDSDGGIGIGYSYTIGTGGSSVVALLEDHLAPLLIGENADNIEHLWQKLFFATHATAVGAITSLALAAIDTALWDLRSKKTGLPLWQLLGGYRRKVPLYTTEGGWLHIETSELVDDAVRAKEAGFGGSKIKVGRPIAEDVARLRAVRDAVGDNFEIFTDANQAFNVDEAIRRARCYEPLDIGWLEEPMPAENLHGHIRLSRSTTLPIAVGESMYSINHFNEYLKQDACSIVQADVARIGGITPWMKVAHLAESYGVVICPHFLMELHVALCAAVPNARWVEYIPQLDDIVTEQMQVDSGHAVASDELGLGIAWSIDEIERRRVNAHTAVIK